MRLYFAATFGHRASLLPYKTRVERDRINHVVTSQWLTEADERPEELTAKQDAILCAQRDITDILGSDVLVFFVDGDSHGKWVELGYAYARGIPVWIVGPEPDPNDRLSGRSIFARALPTRRFASPEALCEYLEANPAGHICPAYLS